jgi:hypothetical protein
MFVPEDGVRAYHSAAGRPRRLEYFGKVTPDLID